MTKQSPLNLLKYKDLCVLKGDCHAFLQKARNDDLISNTKYFINRKNVFKDISMKQPAIYIMTNNIRTTLYTGVTSDLIGRVYEHKNSIKKGFTSRYKCEYLVYYEFFDTMEYAITREKQIKAGSREKKISLIESLNPQWNDLYDGLF